MMVMRPPSPPGGGGGSVLFEANPADSTLFGFDDEISLSYGDYCVRDYLAAGGHAGGGAFRWTPTVANSAFIVAHSNVTQWYNGFQSPSYTSPTQGNRIVYRCYFKGALVNPDVWQNASSTVVVDDGFEVKWVICGENAGADNARHIIFLGNNGTDFAVRVMRNVDGPDYATLRATIPDDSQFHALQVVIQSGSTFNATDGYYRVYVDNDIEGSPDASKTGIEINVAASGQPGTWTNVGFPGFWDNTLADEGQSPLPSMNYVISAFEVGTAFDASWAASL